MYWRCKKVTQGEEQYREEGGEAEMYAESVKARAIRDATGGGNVSRKLDGWTCVPRISKVLQLSILLLLI